MTGAWRGRRRLSLFLPILLATLLASACGGGSSLTGTKGFVSGDGVIEQVAPKDRQELPPVTGDLLNGGQFDSRDYRGRVVVYNVWGSWCAPCRQEAPVLRKVWGETRDRGVQFVGIDVKDTDVAARAFERRYRITYPSITTADSAQALLAFGSALPPSAIPSTVVVDRDGKVAARVLGATTYSTLSAIVKDTLHERTRPAP